MRIRLICALVAVVALATAAGSALAAKPGTDNTCSGGLIAAGTYGNFTVTGTCFFAQPATLTADTVPSVTINGNLTIAKGASLNAHDGTVANVTVTGNVIVDQGGILGLGEYDEGSYIAQNTVVDGNIIANQPQTLYLSFVSVHGNVVSHGGSAGPGVNFPLKNLTVGGNVDLQGWNGFWIGLFRSTVGGNVIFSKNTGTQTGKTGLPDSSEVAGNTISGNLICQGNDPAAQLGDSGGALNTVGGQALGQCAGLATHP